MVSYSEYNEKILEFDEKISHARQAVLFSREREIKKSKIKPEWVATALLVVLFSDAMRMMSVRSSKLSLTSIVLLSLIIVAYTIYSLTIYIPNIKERRLSESVFEEKNIILESLIEQRKAIFEEFAVLNSAKIFRSISSRQDIAIWRTEDELFFASLINGLTVESAKVELVNYIAADSMLKAYNQMIGGYKINANNNKSNNKNIDYSYIFLSTGKTFVFVSKAYEYLKQLLPDKELIDIIGKGSYEKTEK